MVEARTQGIIVLGFKFWDIKRMTIFRLFFSEGRLFFSEGIYSTNYIDCDLLDLQYLPSALERHIKRVEIIENNKSCDVKPVTSDLDLDQQKTTN